MQIIATKFSAAIDLLANTARGGNTLLEVNADGSIRTQNWKEKLRNWGSRLTGNYQLRKDTKDAAVVVALIALAQKAASGSDPIEKNLLDVHSKNMETYGFIARYRDAKQRIDERNAATRPVGDSQVRKDSVASLHAQGAVPQIHQYVEPQDGQLCLKHAIAAFCNHPVFQGREDFLAYRNTIYQTMGDFIPQESFGREDSDVEAVSNMLNAMQADPLYREGFNKPDQNWVIHEISIERVGKPVDEPNDERQLNDALERFAAQSEGKRFIIRTGSRYGSGHYSLLSKNANGSWTFTNSVGSSIQHGSSPARLIEYQRARNMPLYLWTQTDKTPEEFERAIPRQVLN